MKYSIRITLVLALLGALAGPAAATLINVNTFAGESISDGNCSITEAVEAANTNLAVDGCPAGLSAGTDRIVINLIGTITLEQTLNVTEQLSIEGRSRGLTRLSGDNQRKILRIEMTDDSDDFTLSDIRLEDGRSRNTSQFLGGGAAQIYQGGSFTFRNVDFFSNGVDWVSGGAIFAGPLTDNPNATLTIENCLFDGNFAERGGAAIATFTSQDFQALRSINIRGSRFINNRTAGVLPTVMSLNDLQTVTIESSQFENNFSFNTVGSGGSNEAVLITGADPRTLTIIRDTGFIDNEGEALLFIGGDALLSNVLFYSEDPAIRLFNGTFASVTHSSFVNHGDSGSPQLDICATCSANLGASIVWSDAADTTECLIQSGGVLTSLGNNLDSTGSCATGMDDLPMTDPLLLPLDTYGPQSLFYAVKSVPPRTSSPAVDLGPADSCPGFFGASLTNDQRGYTRPVDGDGNGSAECDSGSIEYQPGLDEDDFALSVVFLGSGDGRVVSSPAGIDCTSNCSAIFLEDTMVTLTPTPDAGNSFVGWSGACVGTGACVVDMDQAQTVTASFVASSFQLTINVMGNGTVSSSPAGISCPGDCAQPYPSGTRVTLNANPANGFEFTGWNGGGCSGTASCEVVMSRAQNVTATFSQIEPVLSVQVNGDGSVVSSPSGINCPNDCDQAFNFNQTVTLNASPAPGFAFDGWSGDCSGTGSCQVLMSAARNVAANFIETGATLSVTIGGSGTGVITSNPAGINCPGDCSERFEDGQLVTLTATPDADMFFQNWTGDCDGNGACSITMNEDASVMALFGDDQTIFIDSFE